MAAGADRGDHAARALRRAENLERLLVVSSASAGAAAADLWCECCGLDSAVAEPCGTCGMWICETCLAPPHHACRTGASRLMGAD